MALELGRLSYRSGRRLAFTSRALSLLRGLLPGVTGAHLPASLTCRQLQGRCSRPPAVPAGAGQGQLGGGGLQPPAPARSAPLVGPLTSALPRAIRQGAVRSGAETCWESAGRGRKRQGRGHRPSAAEPARGRKGTHRPGWTRPQDCPRPRVGSLAALHGTSSQPTQRQPPLACVHASSAPRRPCRAWASWGEPPPPPPQRLATPR